MAKVLLYHTLVRVIAAAVLLVATSSIEAENLVETELATAQRMTSRVLQPGWRQKYAYAMEKKIWGLPIHVCFEEIPKDGQMIKIIGDSVYKTWEKAAHIKFSGWNKCDKHTRGIRICFKDKWPKTFGLGTDLAAKECGMILNIFFKDHLNTECGSPDAFEKCLRSSTIHEFGHALGFSHEQNRPDTPDWCKDQADDLDGDWKSKIWDEDSVMNYCGSRWPGPQVLSNIDRQAAEALYGSYE